VPVAAPHDTIFSVSYRENSRSEMINQRQQRAQAV
jgi:hypothetical protein